MAKSKKWKVISPIVEAKFIDLPYIYQGDGSTKSAPKYKVVLKLDPANDKHLKFIKEIKAFQEKVDKELDKMIAKLPPQKRKKITKYLPLEEDYDMDGNPTGFYILKASGGYPPVLIDAKKQEIKYTKVNGIDTYKLPGYNPDVKVGLSFSTEPYINGTNAGVTCYPVVIQIIKVKSSVDLSEFEEVEDEDAFVASEDTNVTSGESLIEEDETDEDADTPPRFGDF